MAENVGLPEGFVLDQPQQSTQQSTQQPSLGSRLMGYGLGGAGAVGVAKGIQKVGEISAEPRTEIAGNMINSIIKPRHKDYSFGKNPGQGVAQEGIAGWNLKDIGNKVGKRLDELTTYAKEYRSLPEHQGKTVNLEKALDPFYEGLDELGKAPETHSAKINEIYGMVSDLEGNLPKGMSLKEVPIETAYGIKKIVQSMQKWGKESEGDNILNAKLKQVYHNVDAAVDEVLPELKGVNSRIANLISAKQAIRARAEVLSRQDPAKISSLLDAVPHLVSNTATKSGLAKILAEKFGGLTKKGVSGVMAFAPVLSAIDASQKMQEAKKKGMYQIGSSGEIIPVSKEDLAI